MMAFRPLARSWQKTTCSWPASLRWSVRSKTVTAADYDGRSCPQGRATMPDVTAFAAHLRVYEPLAAFDREERRHWESYLRAGNIPSVQGGMAMEAAAGVRAVVGR